jgi:hypothetical protein
LIFKRYLADNLIAKNIRGSPNLFVAAPGTSLRPMEFAAVDAKAGDSERINEACAQKGQLF